MNLIIVCEIESTLQSNTEEEIQFWLDNDDYWSTEDYSLVKL